MKTAEITKRVRKQQIAKNRTGGDAIQVFCRVRPLPGTQDHSCIQIIHPSHIQLTPPSHNRMGGAVQDVRYTFKQIFDELSDQKRVFDTVALPCIETVLNGKNALIFTYGVSGSGKTYTMAGTPQNAGLLPRSLDVIFNSISARQVKKCTFVPDKLNSFDIQSEEEAKADRNKQLIRKISDIKKSKPDKDSEADIITRAKDDQCVFIAEERNGFAVFVNYVEIYNNTVYDLLEDLEDTSKPKPLQSKIIREDCDRRMFVHGVNEMEVGSTDEVFEVYYKGLKRKKTAHTLLNNESSRSHSVFTIRIVQAPLDATGEDVLKDRSSMTISQLSLVDLAGSERTNKTKNQGQRLREAGNINNSLLSLKMCLEAMRENQKGGSKVVPYRDSRLTHLFKNFFEGEGQISMILCILPHVDDLEELMHVLKFAEMTQEVQILPAKKICFTPTRRKRRDEPSEIVQNMQTDILVHHDAEAEGGGDAQTAPDLPSFPTNWYSDLPDCRFFDIQDDNAIPSLINYLEDSRNQFLQNIPSSLKESCVEGKNKLLALMRDSMDKSQEIHNLQNVYKIASEKVSRLETQSLTTDSELIKMKKKMDDLEMSTVRLKKENSRKETLINKNKLDKEKMAEEFKHKLVQEQDKLNREFERKLKSQNSAHKYEIRNREKKIKAVKRILSKEEITDSETDASSKKRMTSEKGCGKSIISVVELPCTSKSSELKNTPHSETRKAAVSNRRHRRSRSAGNDVWLDHRPKTHVPLGTLMQPTMAKRKSITKLTNAKDVTEVASKYCLLTQNQDSDGDLETRLYKGDVIPTSGGGAQVLFNDVEVLRQESPTCSSSPRRMSELRRKFEDFCAASSFLRSPRL